MALFTSACVGRETYCSVWITPYRVFVCESWKKSLDVCLLGFCKNQLQQVARMERSGMRERQHCGVSPVFHCIPYGLLAVFSQAYPAIKLSLLDFEGQAFAQRIFYPADYLPADSDNAVPASESVEISLQIALPTEKIGGYTFELI